MTGTDRKAMLRNLTRWTGYLLLAAAMGIGVLDGARSLSVSALDLTSLWKATAWIAPRQIAFLEEAVSGATDAGGLKLATSVLLSVLMSLPAGVIFFVLGGVLLVLGRPPELPAVAEGETFQRIRSPG